MTTQRRDNLIRFFGAIFGIAVTLAVVQIASAAPDDSAMPATATLADRALATLKTLLQGALGGIVIYAVGKGFAALRRRKGWLRRGLVGDVSATISAALITVGGAIAIGATWEGAMLALGAVIVGGKLLASDPDTVTRSVPAPATSPPTAAAGLPAPLPLPLSPLPDDPDDPGKP